MCVGSVPSRVRLIEMDQLTRELMEQASNDLIDITNIEFDGSHLYVIIEPGNNGDDILKIVNAGVKQEADNLNSREDVINLIEEIIDGKRTYTLGAHISTAIQGRNTTVTIST